MKARSKLLLNVVALTCLVSAVRAPAQPLLRIDKKTIIATLHAEGAQIYECKPDTSIPPSQSGALTWQFREPIATLMIGGQTVGWHSAGPRWDLVDGGGVRGRLITSAPAPAANDIPWLELEVVDRHSKGILSEAVTVLRTNTKGGLAPGACESEGKYLSIPYAADYLFLRKSD
jgi:Protein of unknown function (DUF3455)